MEDHIAPTLLYIPFSMDLNFSPPGSVDRYSKQGPCSAMQCLLWAQHFAMWWEVHREVRSDPRQHVGVRAGWGTRRTIQGEYLSLASFSGDAVSTSQM